MLGKKSKHNVIRFLTDKEGKLEHCRQLLISKTYKTSPYCTKKVYEPKERLIYVLPFFPDRIIQHALMNVVSPIWEGMFYDHSYACRVGKGGKAGSARTMDLVMRYDYCLKCDISKFYPSIDQEVLMRIIERKIKDPDVLWLMRDIVSSFPGGKNVPIGNYTSQWFGNLYLNELDRFVLDELKVSAYVRYCDDFCLFSDNKAELHEAARRMREFLQDHLKLKFSKCDVFPVYQGVDFLGYRHFRRNGKSYVLLRKSTARRVIRRIKRLPRQYEAGKISFDTFRSSIGSTYGWLKPANTRNLSVSIKLDELMEECKNVGLRKRLERKFAPAAAGQL